MLVICRPKEVAPLQAHVPVTTGVSAITATVVGAPLTVSGSSSMVVESPSGPGLAVTTKLFHSDVRANPFKRLIESVGGDPVRLFFCPSS
jgi:hypothetical protein